MPFVNLLRDIVCHPESVAVSSGRTLYCGTCQKELIPDVYAFVLQPFEDHFHSSALAQAFHAWTGDDRVPMTFPVVDLEGILSKRVVGQTLKRVRECVHLLRAINAPFTSDPSAGASPPDLTNGFLARYMESVVAHQKSVEMSTEQRMLNHIVQGMLQVVRSDEFAEPFDFYFQTLVPFVRNCAMSWTPFPALPPEANAAKELLIQLQRSDQIRRTFGIYSVPFDVIHAMVASYGCSHDLEMVGNWVLDFMVRLCRGSYFWKRYPDCVFVKAMHRCLSTEVTRRNHMPLYRVLQQIRQGQAVHGLSSLWKPYLQLVALVDQKYQVRGMSSDVLRMACHQMFPAVLFEDHADQVGFTMATAHLVMTVDHRSGQVPKGGFKKARQIYETIQRFVLKVCQFESDPPTIWTLDTLRMFLLCEPHLEKEIVSVVQLLLTTEDSDPDEPMDPDEPR